MFAGEKSFSPPCFKEVAQKIYLLDKITFETKNGSLT